MHVKITDEEANIRRAPRQQRSRQTVEVILEAVERVLKREGVDAITTNRIAEAAGVSIGSVYQYFPDKKSIFTALHQRHVEQVSQVIEKTVVEHASSSLESFTCALVERLMDLHDLEPGLHEIISEVVPESAQGFRLALQETSQNRDCVSREGIARSADAARSAASRRGTRARRNGSTIGHRVPRCLQAGSGACGSLLFACRSARFTLRPGRSSHARSRARCVSGLRAGSEARLP